MNVELCSFVDNQKSTETARAHAGVHRVLMYYSIWTLNTDGKG